MQLIDLTQTFGSMMPVYPGDPAPELKQITTIETHGFTDHQLTTAMHVGTHMDAPLHMIAGGKKIAEMFWAGSADRCPRQRKNRC
jgi:arylformamidase